MKNGPLLMCAPMVLATLGDRKLQTRRILKDPPRSAYLYLQRMWGRSPPPDPVDFGTPGLWRIVGPDYPDDESDDRACPYGTAGDRLWVKETWASAKKFDHLPPREIPRSARVHHLADGPKPEWAGKTRVSIFMPRWASRITLKITEVRVQQLQEISRADAIAEGMTDLSFKQGYGPRAEFCTLWDSLNAERAPWASNPWVWAISFQRLP